MSMSRLLLLGVCLVLIVASASAAENTILPSSTVFIGEDGLDISATGVVPNTNILWYGTSGTIGSVPSASVLVTDPTSFYVSPALFGGKTGAWFTENGNNLAFYVQNPQILLRVFDTTAGFEVTKSTTWVPKGDTIGFEIDNNVYVIANRPGSSGAPVTIRIRGPNGVEYSSVGSFQLTDIPVNSATYATGPVWFTGDFANGNYTVWAESTGNSMNTNYPQEGQTISAKVTFLMQSGNPLITPTTVRTTATVPQTTVTIQQTTLPTRPPTTFQTPPVTTSAAPTTAPPATTQPTSAPGFGFVPALLAFGVLSLVFLKRQ